MHGCLLSFSDSFFFLQHCIDASVLLDNRLLINFILNYMRGLTGILSISLLVTISMTSFCAIARLPKTLPIAGRKRASGRELKFTEADIKSFTEEQEIQTRKRKL